MLKDSAPGDKFKTGREFSQTLSPNKGGEGVALSGRTHA